MTPEEQDQEEYQDMLSDLESGECVTINDKDEVYFCGKQLGKIGREWEDFDEMISAVNAEMERQQFWPDIYSINDHGNVSLLDNRGNTIKAWV